MSNAGSGFALANKSFIGSVGSYCIDMCLYFAYSNYLLAAELPLGLLILTFFKLLSLLSASLSMFVP